MDLWIRKDERKDKKTDRILISTSKEDIKNVISVPILNDQWYKISIPL